MDPEHKEALRRIVNALDWIAIMATIGLISGCLGCFHK